MDKIVGKSSILFVSLMLFSAMCYAARGQLKLYSHDGMPLTRAGVGQPFMLKFVAIYEDGRLQEPMLEGTHGLTVQRTGFQMRTINRTSEATYTYLVRAKRQGSYIIGPMRYVQNGKECVSNTITVQVGTEQKIDTQAVNNKQKNYAFARLLVNKDSAYVGEKVSYTIRFYYQDPSTEVEHLMRPELSAFTVAEQKQGYAGKEKIKDVVYRFFEWSWDFYPTQVGEHTIGAHRLDFTQARDTDDRFSRFNLFLGPQVDRKRVYTNEATVEVKPLPPYDGHVVGIGSFKNFKAVIEPALSKEGEAMVLSLALEGEGNFDDIQFPQVQQLPDCFRSYPSKQYTQSDGQDGTTKIFEFIVQSMKAGDWEIPSQECSYFDVTSGQYKTIRTSPLLVTVLSAAYVASSSFVDDASHDDINIVIRDELHPIMATWGSTHTERSLPCKWLFVLTLLPWLLIIGWHLFAYMRPRFFSYQRTPLRRVCFKQARAALLGAQKQKDVSQVYPLFVALIAGVYKKTTATITEEYIYGLIDDDAWRTYVARAAEYAFYVPNTDTSAFFVEGLAWLDKLEGKP